MSKFEAQGDDLLKNSQEKGGLDNKENAGTEDKKEEEASQEEDKTLGEIKELTEDIEKTFNEAKTVENKLVKYESDPQSMREAEEISARYQEKIGEIELKHGKVFAILFGIAGASFLATVAGQETIEFFRGSIADKAGTITCMAASAAAMFTVIRMEIKTAILHHKENKEIYQ